MFTINGGGDCRGLGRTLEIKENGDFKHKTHDYEDGLFVVVGGHPGSKGVEGYSNGGRFFVRVCKSMDHGFLREYIR